jgi:hypothetical protein
MSKFARAIKLFAPCLLAVVAAGSHAQVMYRCGKTFQDRPCESGVNEQRIVPGGASPSAPGMPGSTSAAVASSPYAAECRRRGEHAQRITWQREAGATAERQINDARGDRDMIELVQNVYARRGTAPEIRSAVESECVVEKQKAAEAAAALAALQQQAAKGGQATGSAGVTTTPSDAAAATVQAKPVVATTGANPACAGLRSRKDNVESRLRAGGSAQTMESWQRERRDIERQMSEAKC